MPQVQRLLEEYYKLDYEDVVGGVRTRFRWAAGTPHVLRPAGWPAGWLDVDQGLMGCSQLPPGAAVGAAISGQPASCTAGETASSHPRLLACPLPLLPPLLPQVQAGAA